MSQALKQEQKKTGELVSLVKTIQDEAADFVSYMTAVFIAKEKVVKNLSSSSENSTP